MANTSGTFPAIFIASANPFKIILKSAAGVTLDTIDRIPVGGAIDLETLGQIVDQAGDQADRSELAAAAAGAAADAAAAATGLTDYPTVVVAQAASVPASILSFRVRGLGEPGDGFERIYAERSAVQPAHPRWIQTADGSFWTSTAPVYAIFASGQSNMTNIITEPYTWEPPPNLWTWTGFGWARDNGQAMSTGRAYAAAYAKAHPTVDVFVCSSALGAASIDRWIGLDYFFNSTPGSIAPGQYYLGSDGGGTTLLLHKDDVAGKTRLAGQAILPAVTTSVRIETFPDPSNYVEYSITSVTDGGTYQQFSVTQTAAAGTISPMAAVKVFLRPNLYDQLATVKAAQDALGVAAYDKHLWWQGESNQDLVPQSAYVADYENKDQLLIGRGIITDQTPTLIFGIVGYSADYEAFNNQLREVVNKAPNRRGYFATSDLPVSWRDANHHFTKPEHYKLLGEMAVRQEAYGLGRLPPLLGKLVETSGTAGYKDLGGIIIQWGVGNPGDLGTINFPMRFPNKCLNVQVAPFDYNPAPGAAFVAWASGSTPEGFSASIRSLTATGPASTAAALSYVAIGY